MGWNSPAATTLPRDGAARTANSQQMVQTCHHVWPWALSQCSSAAAGFVVHPLRAISSEWEAQDLWDGNEAGDDVCAIYLGNCNFSCAKQKRQLNSRKNKAIWVFLFGGPRYVITQLHVFCWMSLMPWRSRDLQVFPNELGRHFDPVEMTSFFCGQYMGSITPVSRWISTQDGVFLSNCSCFEQSLILWNIISNWSHRIQQGVY